MRDGRPPGPLGSLLQGVPSEEEPPGTLWACCPGLTSSPVGLMPAAASSCFMHLSACFILQKTTGVGIATHANGKN